MMTSVMIGFVVLSIGLFVGMPLAMQYPVFKMTLQEAVSIENIRHYGYTEVE